MVCIGKWCCCARKTIVVPKSVYYSYHVYVTQVFCRGTICVVQLWKSNCKATNYSVQLWKMSNCSAICNAVWSAVCTAVWSAVCSAVWSPVCNDPNFSIPTSRNVKHGGP